MANDIPTVKLTQAEFDAIQQVDTPSDGTPVLDAVKVEITDAKRSFLKDAAKGLAHVAKVIWQVPAARGAIATLLVRFGLPGTLVAVGMAVGEKLAQ